MNTYFKSVILNSTNASLLKEKELIQILWSGYGKIVRVALEGGFLESIVAKHIQLPLQKNHPRGWNTDIGHQRKLESYKVETNWYNAYSKFSKARLPECFAIAQKDNEMLIVLEDLDQSGFSIRKHQVDWNLIEVCLEWLAKFHASYLGKIPDDIWQIGTYWNLETRPEELVVLEDGALKEAAPYIDKKLNECKFKTFVHGDAKLANFCFSKNQEVAGVDFQYVGGGCGMKDVAYFIGSCLKEEDCKRLENKILDTYFYYLHTAIGKKNEDLEKEWRTMYFFAWADFNRFLKGWSPGHWKLNSYSERVTKNVIKCL